MSAVTGRRRPVGDQGRAGLERLRALRGDHIGAAVRTVTAVSPFWSTETRKFRPSAEQPKSTGCRSSIVRRRHRTGAVRSSRRRVASRSADRCARNAPERSRRAEPRRGRRNQFRRARPDRWSHSRRRAPARSYRGERFVGVAALDRDIAADTVDARDAGAAAAASSCAVAVSGSVNGTRSANSAAACESG